MSGQTLSPSILDYLVQNLRRPVSQRARSCAAVRFADWAGCAAAGASDPVGAAILRSFDGAGDNRSFAWGALGNILEMDDVDKRALLHPGPVIIPAALTVADGLEVAGSRLLDAIVAGYEATIRLGRAVGPAHYALWHNTGTCGSIGAAAASASLLDLSDDQCADALALAVSQSAGLWQTRHEPGNIGKQLHTAHAARAGVTAARLAAGGLRGPQRILEGPQGFFAAMCPGADPQAVLADYGSDWLIRDVSTKPWPACRHAHAAIDAALLLRSEDGPLPTGEIAVETYRDALAFCDNRRPEVPLEAKFSLQHAVAVALVRGPPQLADFSVDAIGDRAIVQVRSRVTVRESEEMTRAYPARFGAIVSIGTRRVRVKDAWGDPENPMTDEDVYAKSRTLLEASGWAAADAADFLEAVSKMPGGGAYGPVISSLQARL